LVGSKVRIKQDVKLMKRLNKRQKLIISALLLPFLSASVITLFGKLLTPVFALFNSVFEGVTAQLEVADDIKAAIILYSLVVIPGLLCLLFALEKPLDRLVYGLIYLLIIPLLIYVCWLIIGLALSGYL
jgi:hypothetical protein